ncbi:MAG: hypothetical protein WC833_08700 [Bacteroidales bacterium]|jgi:hypothetical protein
MSKIYRVSFGEGQDKYFGSLSAIYDVFTPEQIGCKVENLWNIGVSSGTPYNGNKCTITLEKLIRKQTKRGRQI